MERHVLVEILARRGLASLFQIPN